MLFLGHGYQDGHDVRILGLVGWLKGEKPLPGKTFKRDVFTELAQVFPPSIFDVAFAVVQAVITNCGEANHSKECAC